MKQIRLYSMLVVLGVLLASPVVTRADHGPPHACCNRAWDVCNLVICANHGGANSCYVYSGGCGELCQCNDAYFEGGWGGTVICYGPCTPD